MGWYGQYGSNKKTEVARVLQEVKPLDHSLRGNVLYMLVQHLQYGKFIAVYLFESMGGGSYGYKPMDENMGPYYFDCPLRLIKKADPPLTQCAAEWREAVRNKGLTKG